MVHDGNRRLARASLAGAVATLALLAACAPAGAIVGGAPVAITAHPFQIALLDNIPSRSNYNAEICGGTVRDVTHIVTAAHCVFNSPASPSGQVVAASDIVVLAGTGVLDDSTAGRLAVQAVSFMPGYSNNGTYRHDAALLTLAQPLALGPAIAPLPLVDAADWAGVGNGTPAFVTGWGDIDNRNTYPRDLRGAAVPILGDAQCAALSSGFYAPESTCAGGNGADSCDGDSGGPLVVDFGGPGRADRELVGIVSTGSLTCGASPGVYTEVASPPVRSFLTTALPQPAPRVRADPAIGGTATVGSGLLCAPGRFSDSPAIDVQWVRTRAGVDSALTVPTALPAGAGYTVAAADAGSTIACIVRATNAGGTALARSAPTAPVPGQAIGGTTVSQRDGIDPVARISSASCRRSTCTLKVAVTDAGFSSGIAKLTATVRTTYRGTCKRGARRVACTRQRYVKATVKRTATGRYTVTATRLPVGRQQFALVAFDKAGNRQRLATRRTLTTKTASKPRAGR